MLDLLLFIISILIFISTYVLSIHLFGFLIGIIIGWIPALALSILFYYLYPVLWYTAIIIMFSIIVIFVGYNIMSIGRHKVWNKNSALSYEKIWMSSFKKSIYKSDIINDFEKYHIKKISPIISLEINNLGHAEKVKIYKSSGSKIIDNDIIKFSKNYKFPSFHYNSDLEIELPIEISNINKKTGP
ncbi:MULTISPECIES: hypothetical protein [Acidiphilium]|uniref:hypothetical protein n=1 Tax=Acidiphilium TaxID=522 RepID=UPI00110FEBB5|nr:MULTISPECIES: hypothetical protein [Acidiphilium]